MTTQTYSSIISHNSDAAYREWGLQLSNALTAAGLPKSADTGQVDWGTAIKPAQNASLYEIRYLNDSLHASKPCYIKIEYGSNPNSSILPCIWITVGTGTNGAGTITGVMFTRRENIRIDSLKLTSVPTNICVKDGYFVMMWARGVHTDSLGGVFFAMMRTCDSSGTPNSTGFYFYYQFNSSNQLYRNMYVTSEQVNGFNTSFVPGGVGNTLISGNPQVFPHFATTPELLIVPQMLTYINSEISALVTFTVTPVGVTPRTYLTIGSVPFAYSNAQNTGNSAAWAYGVAFQFD